MILVSATQLKAIKQFFSHDIEDILFWWGARWWKSETEGILLAICIAAFPGSNWLLSRTQLADLKATTLATFFKVIKRLWYDDKSYRDKIRDERHIEFVNNSKLFVIQTNLEPSDPEFDRVWSYGYTGVFLDEAQQMANKLREVLSWRLSELDGSFKTEVPIEYRDYTIEEMKPWYTIRFGVVSETVKDKNDIQTEEYEEVVLDWGKYCVITGYYTLEIPYKLLDSQIINGKLIHTYSWTFKGIIFSSCNPGVNYTRTDFYKPWKAWTLPSYMDFIPSLVGDNPWVDQKFIERLERLPDSSIRKQRLLYGNFDFDDNPGILYDQNTIEKMYSRIYDGDDTKYLTIDAARQGKDGTEIGRWEWLHLIEITNIDKADLVEQAEVIEQMIHKYGIDIDNVIVDEVWVGGGLVDMLGCKGFIGNSQPLHPYESKLLSYLKRNYLNLRTQSFYYLQKYMSLITITTDNDTQDKITEELLTVKEKDVANDGKMQIIAKKLMKEELWRSPDLADMIGMRMWWLIRQDHIGWGQQYNESIEIKTDEQVTDESLMKFLEWFEGYEEKKIVNNIEEWAF